MPALRGAELIRRPRPVPTVRGPRLHPPWRLRREWPKRIRRNRRRFRGWLASCGLATGAIRRKRFLTRPTAADIAEWARRACGARRPAGGIVESIPGGDTLAGARRLAGQFDVRYPKPRLPGAGRPKPIRAGAVEAVFPTAPPLPPWAPGFCKRDFVGYIACEVVLVPGPASAGGKRDRRIKWYESQPTDAELKQWSLDNCFPPDGRSTTVLPGERPVTWGRPPEFVSTIRPGPPTVPSNAVLSPVSGGAPIPPPPAPPPGAPAPAPTGQVWWIYTGCAGQSFAKSFDHSPTVAEQRAWVQSVCP